MGARDTPASPSSDSCASDPVKKTSQSCDKCWTDDYDKEISAATQGRYSQAYDKSGAAHNYNIQRQFKLYAPVKTGAEITVELRFKAESDTGVGAAQITTAKANLEKGVNTYWNNRYTIEANDSMCGKKSFKVKFKIVWADSGQHYTIKVHDTYAREGVTGDVMDVSKTTTDWTYAHEFAHCFGVPDEYSYTTDTETVKYYKPDGTLDAAISAPPGGKASNAADATIMSAVNNTTRLERHCWPIAIETQDLLTEKLGRKITCTVK